MMKVLATLLLLAALPVRAPAQNLPGMQDLPEAPRYIAGYLAAGGGLSVPSGGHWGDNDTGFKPSPAFSLAASKRVDEFLSWGLETSYAADYKNRGLKDLKIKMFSLTPFLKVSVPEGDRLLYGVLGAGIYQWSQPAFISGAAHYASDSGSSAGINLGGGVSWPFWWGTRAGLDLRWHHVFNMTGSNFKLDSADNINIMLVVSSSLWMNRAR